MTASCSDPLLRQHRPAPKRPVSLRASSSPVDRSGPRGCDRAAELKTGEALGPMGVWRFLRPLRFGPGLFLIDCPACGRPWVTIEVDTDAHYRLRAPTCAHGCDAAAMARRLGIASGTPAEAFMPLPDAVELRQLECLLVGQGPVGRAWRGVDRFRSPASRRLALRLRLTQAGASETIAAIAVAAFDRRLADAHVQS